MSGESVFLEDQGVQKKHVSVIGGGMVGSLLAVMLSERGLKVHLYESRPDQVK